MGRFKAARGKSKGPKSRGLVPCLILLVSGLALLTMLFYSFVRSGS